MKKRTICLILALFLMLTPISAAATNEPLSYQAVLEKTLSTIEANNPTLSFGSVGGEWAVLALARGKALALDDAYFESYYEDVCTEIKELSQSVNLNGALHKTKSTENSRVILALSALGKDVTNVNEVDLLAAYSKNGFTWIKKQGINGVIYALLALDCRNYPTEDETIREQCLDFILSKQLPDGGWALSGTTGDPDITAMAVQALANHLDVKTVKDAAQNGISCLSGIQKTNGSFASWGAENAESIAQVIVACSAMGIDPAKDERFVKQGRSALDALLDYYLEDAGGFAHVLKTGGGYTGGSYNAMATEQAAYALVAYDRFVKGEPSLYDMSDLDVSTGGRSRSHFKLTRNDIPISYTDVKTEDWYYEDISFVTQTGLFVGATAERFCPHAPMSRGMLVTVLYRLAGKPKVSFSGKFSDVSQESLFAAAVSWAVKNKIVNGVDKTHFDPSGDVTREQLAAILLRYAKSERLKTRCRGSLENYADAASVSEYARDAMLWVVSKKLIRGSGKMLEPKKSTSRAEAAAVINRFCHIW